MNPWLQEVFGAYVAALVANAARYALLFAVVAGGAWWWDRRGRAAWGDRLAPRSLRIGRMLLAATAVAGLWLAYRNFSIFDDAFISFRYARNWADGAGLVFNNPGERVEGYTNFLWTVVIGVLLRLTSVDAPWIATALTVACFLANLVVVYRIGCELARRHAPTVYVPVAAILLGVSVVFTAYATSGMETMAASLLVNLGLWFFLASEGARGAFWMGASLILATLTRPDHALFYAIGGLVVFGETAARARSEGGLLRGTHGLLGGGGRRLVAYAVPFACYVPYLFWKVAYYGSLLPNTYYAKSAGLSYYGQGVVYAATFYLGSMAWIPAALFCVWLLLPSGDSRLRWFKVLCGVSFFAMNLFILRVGGDFMYGRFYVTLLPLALIGAEDALYGIARGARESGTRSRRIAAVLFAGALAVSAADSGLMSQREPRWYIANESAWYLVAKIRPLEIANDNFYLAKLLRRNLTDHGLRPLVAAANVGLLSYYAELPVIDIFGLTDPVIAKRPIRPDRRGRPGHEKNPNEEYLVWRGVRFMQGNCHPEEYREMASLTFDDERIGTAFFIFTYDRDLMRRIARVAPEIHFLDFEAFLDEYIAVMKWRDPQDVARDLPWFRRYYFDHNDDSERLEPLERYAGS